MTIAAGSLREYVIISRPVLIELPDGSMSTIEDSVLLRTFCRLKQERARIDVVGARDNLAQAIVFEMRFRTDIVFRIGDRLEWRGRNLKIHSFSWDILRTVLTVVCFTHNEDTSVG